MSPDSVITNDLGQFNPGAAPINMINRSGLSSAFVSGTTDFNTYVGSAPTHSRSSAVDTWVGAFGFDSGTLEFDLGDMQVVEQLALWNGTTASNSAINLFTVSTADNAAFTGATIVGMFNNPQNDASFPFPVSVFDLVDSTAQFVRLEIVSNHGSSGLFGLTGIGEIAFDTSIAAVPEPTTFGMLSIGAVGLIYRRRRRRASELT